MKEKKVRHLIIVAGLAALTNSHSLANPTGGQVVGGAATINTLPGVVTVNQQSNIAIINWQTFSIGAGELTKFVQPSTSSAVLNRVLGGQTSLINGTLSANGSVYLVNGNGIVVGPSGLVNANSFTASTRDIADSDFLSGKLHFTSNNAGTIQNFGTINALGGNVYLLGKTVDNQGTINAPNGTVGLGAGDDFLLAQQNADGTTFTVNPTTTATKTPGQTAVNNGGTINATSAELKAVNGNLYALAINNTGTIRATTVKHQGGRIYLLADSGAVVNSGILDASATASKGQGGNVMLKNLGGSTSNHGKIFAKGGQGGKGGMVELSGKTVPDFGTVDTSAPGGTTGNLLIDPAIYNVSPFGGDTTGLQVSAQLEKNNLILNADNILTINDSLNWTSANTLTLSTNNLGSTIRINSPINSPSGGLIIQGYDSSAQIFTSVNGAIDVASFILQSGTWVQNGTALPAFQATLDFEINGGSFLRAAGGDGSATDPYIINDVYGLQGIDSLPQNNSYALGNNIDASVTRSWNSSLYQGLHGFRPIGSYNYYYYEGLGFTGTFDGRGYVINGLYINNPNSNYYYYYGTGLFGYTSQATVKNVGLINTQITGGYVTGILSGYSYNTLIDSCYSTGTVNGQYAGGLVGYSDTSSTINNSQSSASVTGSYWAGGLVGENGGAVRFCSSSGSVDASAYAGGLIGYNFGSVRDSYTTSPVNSTSGYAGGLAGFSENYYYNNVITDCYSIGKVTGAYTGGLVGNNYNSGLYITDSFYDEQTSGITVSNGAGTPKPTAYFQDAANFPTSWNFSTVWQSDGAYPTLRNNPIAIDLPPTKLPDPVLTSTTTAALNNFDAYTANGAPQIVNVNFNPNGTNPTNNDTTSDESSGNSGSGPHKKGGNLASGSSNPNGPAPIRLLTGGSGINSIFQGNVNPVQPSPLVLQKFQLILNNTTENELSNFVFGTH